MLHSGGGVICTYFAAILLPWNVSQPIYDNCEYGMLVHKEKLSTVKRSAPKTKAYSAKVEMGNINGRHLI